MKKKIGLFLSSEPNSGGVYQYSLSIIKALDSFDTDRYSLRCFFFDDRWAGLIPHKFKKFKIHKKFINRFLGYMTSRLFRFPSGWRFAGHFSDSASAINGSDCDVVIYPGQDAVSYQTNKKSIVAIHDLMHRYESYFEEYQGQECANRDTHYSAICRYSDLILTDSQIGKQHVLESYNCEDNKVHVLPFVPPYYLLESNQVNVKLLFDLPERFIFYPAQFWEHKNHINLLAALNILKDRGECIKLVFVGSQKNNYSRVMASIDEYGLAKNVLVLGYVSNDEMYSLYKSAVAMVFVSLIGPTNIPPMEALITGCPLICSNVYAMPDQVGDAALFVNPLDTQDIAEKIQLAWNEPAIRQRLVSSGYQQINKYGQEDFGRRLSDMVSFLV